MGAPSSQSSQMAPEAWGPGEGAQGKGRTAGLRGEDSLRAPRPAWRPKLSQPLACTWGMSGAEGDLAADGWGAGPQGRRGLEAATQRQSHFGEDGGRSLKEKKGRVFEIR